MFIFDELLSTLTEQKINDFFYVGTIIIDFYKLLKNFNKINSTWAILSSCFQSKNFILQRFPEDA